MTDNTLLLNALLKIAAYPSGGRIVPGTAEGDRDEMIGAARQALAQYYGVGSYAAVLARLAREDRA